MLVFNLYIGSVPRSPLSPPVTLEWLNEILSPLFPSFTISEANGVFRGMTEHTFVVKVTPLDITAFHQNVDSIRQRLDQDGIGVEHGTGYHRIAEGEDFSGWFEEIFRTIRPEYLHTVFRATPPEKGSWPGRFAVVTAWNPDGRLQTDAANAQSDAVLAGRLTKMGIAHWRVTGTSPDGLHTETGFGIETGLFNAICIAREFRQEAVYSIQNENLSVISCTCKAEVPIGRWEAKQIA